MRKRVGVKGVLLTLLLVLACSGAGWVVAQRLPARQRQMEMETPEQTPVSSAMPEPTAPPPVAEIPAAMENAEKAPAGSDEEESLWVPAGPLAIYEVTLADGDRVELRNVSDDPVRLSDYYLSDKNKDRKKLQLPDVELPSGEFYVSEELSLSVKGDSLWLSDEDENVVDFVKIPCLSVGGSYGRLVGEGGWFFFAVPSMGAENTNGFRRMSEKPEPSLPSGPYDDVETVTVSLSGPGVIHYTTDCSAPTAESPVYTEPLSLNQTTIVRAICVEEDALPSRIATFHYFINEYHKLPIVSFCSDDLGAWTKFYWEESRFGEFAGAVALYADGEEVFNQACGLRLKGFSAVLDLLKKNVGFYFRGRYGDGALEDLDLFHTGVTEYKSLIVRAGQDHRDALIRNELMQELCLQASESVPSQHSLFCVMYMNGHYRGIYCLKDNMNEHFLSDIYGVSPESFVNLRQLKDVNEYEPLQQVIHFCMDNDMSDPELYAQFCDMFDIDNFIDYILLEGFCGNVDFEQNVRYFYSDEMDGRWRFAFFDLDCSFYSYYCGMRVIFEGYAKQNHNVTRMSNSLIRNPDFRDQLLRRYAQWIEGPLSPENVMREIDLLEEEIRPEIVRDREHIGIDMEYWEARMADLRSFATDDYISATIDTLCEDLELTPEERTYYFGNR